MLQDFHVAAEGFEACSFIESQGTVVELPHVELKPFEPFFLYEIENESDHGAGNALPSEVFIHAEFIDIQEIPLKHKGVFRTVDMVQNGKTADLSIGFRHDNFLTGIIPDGEQVIPELVTETGLEDVRFTGYVQVIDLTAQQVDGWEIRLPGKANGRRPVYRLRAGH